MLGSSGKHMIWVAAWAVVVWAAVWGVVVWVAAWAVAVWAVAVWAAAAWERALRQTPRKQVNDRGDVNARPPVVKVGME